MLSVPALGRLFLGLLVAAAVAAAGFILTMLDIGGLIGSPQRRYIAAAWFGAFVVSLAGIFGRMARRIANLEEAQKAKFDIVFLPSNAGEGDSQPYLVDKTFIRAPRTQGEVASRFRLRKYRIGVVNLSTAIVPDVHAVIAACKPTGIDQPVVIGARLQVMDSDPATGERDLHPNSRQDPSLFFDVVRELSPDDAGPAQELGFCYASDGLLRRTRPDVDDKEYAFTVTLRVDGGGYSTQREFKILKTWDEESNRYRKVVMKPL